MIGFATTARISSCSTAAKAASPIRTMETSFKSWKPYCELPKQIDPRSSTLFTFLFLPNRPTKSSLYSQTADKFEGTLNGILDAFEDFSPRPILGVELRVPSRNPARMSKGFSFIKQNEAFRKFLFEFDPWVVFGLLSVRTSPQPRLL